MHNKWAFITPEMWLRQGYRYTDALQEWMLAMPIDMVKKEKTQFLSDLISWAKAMKETTADKIQLLDSLISWAKAMKEG